MPLSIMFPIEMNSKENAGMSSFTDSQATEAIKQNMKMLLLTRQGEYVWDPQFGVGLYSYLFENDATLDTAFIEGQIQEQISAYMPYVAVDGLSVQIDSQYQTLKVQIKFRFNGQSIPELFEVEIS